MSTATTSRRIDGMPGSAAMPAAVAIGQRRAPMRIVAGLLVVAVGALIGAVAMMQLNKAVEVVAVAQPVAAGAVLSDADLTTVSIVPDASLHVVPAAEMSTLVGQTAAVPLIPGSLLVREQVGPSIDPGAGQSLLAVGLKNGHTPAGLAPGTSVLVLVVPTGTATTGAQPVQAPGTVRDVQVPDATGLTVVTLQLATDAAVKIASAGGEATLVVQGR